MIRNVEAAKQLFAKAEQDFLVLGLSAGDSRVKIDSLGFHAQQTAEKCFKAVLQVRAGSYERTHDISELLAALSEAGCNVPENLRKARYLTSFATVFRYTDSTDSDTSALTRQEMVQISGDIIGWAKSEIGV